MFESTESKEKIRRKGTDLRTEDWGVWDCVAEVRIEEDESDSDELRNEEDDSEEELGRMSWENIDRLSWDLRESSIELRERVEEEKS